VIQQFNEFSKEIIITDREHFDVFLFKSYGDTSKEALYNIVFTRKNLAT
jgi:hypothetical protein